MLITPHSGPPHLSEGALRKVVRIRDASPFAGSTEHAESVGHILSLVASVLASRFGVVAPGRTGVVAIRREVHTAIAFRDRGGRSRAGVGQRRARWNVSSASLTRRLRREGGVQQFIQE